MTKTAEVDKLKEERERIRLASKANHDPATNPYTGVQEKQMEVCEICGSFLIVGDAQVSTSKITGSALWRHKGPLISGVRTVGPRFRSYLQRSGLMLASGYIKFRPYCGAVCLDIDKRFIGGSREVFGGYSRPPIVS